MAHPRPPAKPISRELAEILAPRILRRIAKTESGCWLKTTAVNPVTGYAHISITIDGRARYFYAHRVMYTFANGPFPPDMTIDHMCEQPACCNPEHLRLATMRENVLRSSNYYAINARKMHCPRNHPLQPRPNGKGRHCPECRRAQAAARRRSDTPRQFVGLLLVEEADRG